MITIEKKHMKGVQPAFIVPSGCWIAGGAIRAWFTGREKSPDVDVFARDEESLQKFAVENNLDVATKKSTPRTDTYNHKGQPVQLIRVYSQNAGEVISKFDYTICMFVWDGTAVFSTVDAVISVERNHLAVNKFQEGFEVDSLRRAFKYAEKGFKPCLGTIHRIAEELSGISKADVEKQEVLSPGGGTRINLPFWD